MKSKNLLLSLLLLVATVATSAFGQNPKREVVFTLNANEVIYENEYALFQTLNQNRFTCITHDTITDKYTFVFNGQRIKTVSEKYDIVHLDYVNLGEAKGYAFSYEENGKWYINYHGVVDGGFEDILWKDDYYVRTSERDYDYLYKLAGRWYTSKNGKRKKANAIERIYKDGQDYVNVDGSVGGPYDDIDYLRLTESGKYAYSYKDNDKYYVNINGSIVGGHFDDIDDLRLTESGKYAYRYNDNGKWYVNINGSTVGGPYDEYIYGLTLTEDGKYAYIYEDDNNKYYINVNGSTVGGPYESHYCYISYTKDLTLTEDGKYSYRFQKDRKYYINTNGVVTEDRAYRIFEGAYNHDDLDLTSKDGKHSFYSSYEYEYVVIDGRPYGKSPAINAWYDESKNAFIWNAVERRELVVYEYKLD
jgi:hypothetical protein